MKRGREIFLLVIILILWGLFGAALLYSAPFLDRANGAIQVDRLGQFGDSFGGFTALFSGLAAVGAYLAFSHQQKTSATQEFDTNFFSLLANFQSITTSMDVHVSRRPKGLSSLGAKVERTYIGRDAIRTILSILHREIKSTDFKDTKIVAHKYDQFFKKWRDDLGHYFRILYHLVKFVENKAPANHKFYMQIIRAHLSYSETVLLAYNCICGEGGEKFYKMVEEYSLLHNIYADQDDDFSTLEMQFFRRHLKPKAFNSQGKGGIDYNGLPIVLKRLDEH